MPTQSKKQAPKQSAPEEPNPVVEGTKKLLLASIGAIALAQDEIESFVNKLVERGEIAEKEGKKLISELKDKRKKSTEKAQEEINQQVKEVLAKMNVPTKSDVEKLNKQVSELSKKVDELNKSE